LLRISNPHIRTIAKPFEERHNTNDGRLVGEAVRLSAEHPQMTVFPCTEDYGLLELRRLSDETVGVSYVKRKYFSI